MSWSAKFFRSCFKVFTTRSRAELGMEEKGKRAIVFLPCPERAEKLGQSNVGSLQQLPLPFRSVAWQTAIEEESKTSLRAYKRHSASGNWQVTAPVCLLPSMSCPLSSALCLLVLAYALRYQAETILSHSSSGPSSLHFLYRASQSIPFHP